MDTKKAPSSATRKISRKDGRYLEDSNTHISKSVHRSRSSREKSSRSPLRATTLESNVKSHVAFREPLASYRDASASSTPNERDILQPALGLNAGEREERDFESTRSSAVANTNVRYLNDPPAIDALELRLSGSPNELANSALHTYRGVRAFETLQPNTSFNSSNNRLETLKRRQPDAKLEKLKERIRRQWELAGEKDVREGLHSSAHYSDPTANAKTRKVTSAPPAPVYKGFNPPDKKISTLDSKLCKGEDSSQLYGTLQPSFREGISTNETSQMKKSSRPVRKVQRLVDGGSTGIPESKPVKGSIISTSSWRDGQKLVKQLLGPTPKIEKELKGLSDDKHTLKATPPFDGPINKRQGFCEKDAGKRSVSSERQIKEITKPRGKQIRKRSLSQEKQMENEELSSKSAASSVGYSEAVREIDKYCRDPAPTTSSQNDDKIRSHATLDNYNKYQTEPAELKKDFLPLEIQCILDDLQLDSGIEGQKQTRGRSKSPTKRKPGKSHAPQEPHISSKRRHYDTEQVRLYILRQQEERKRKHNEEKEAQKQAEEQKNKRLQELYQKQKEAFSKAKGCATGQYVQERELQDVIYNHKIEPKIQQPPETVPRLMLRHAWSDLSAQEKQPKVLYQPSGESDKENKGQERPTSASSGSDLSLSEPLQPLLRSDLADTYNPTLDNISSKGPLPQSLNQTKGGDLILSRFLTVPKDLESLLSSRKSTANPETNKTYFQTKPPSNFRTNLDRIESLKATAVSLSSRIESEAKKLAGGSLAFPSTWGPEPDHINNNTTIWKKPDSPPERDGGDDIFSARIQKMIGTCESHFSQKDLPGANDLYKKLPDEFLSNRNITHGGREVINDRRPSPGRDERCRRPTDVSSNTSPLQNSSTSSISEGSLLSEGSLSEGEGIPRCGSPLFSNKLLKTKAFCMKDQGSKSKSLELLDEFKREAEKYEPLVTSSAKGPWEELAKGSPNSVINIFTKSCQLYSKELDGRLERNSPALKPPYTSASPQNSVSYADDFNSCQVSQSGNQIVRQQSLDTSVSSVNEELPKSRNEGSSSSSSGARSASSSASYLSQEGSKLKKSFQNDSSHFPLEDQSSSSSKHKNLASKHTPLSPGREPSAGNGTDTDSTIGDLSSRSVTSFDSGRDVKNRHTNVTEIGAQIPAPTTTTTTGGSVTQPSDLVSGTVQGSKHYSPMVLQQRMSAELNYLSAMEESVRQLCDVERVRGISLAQQETVSLAQILKAQQQRHEQNMAALRQQAEQEAQASLRQLEDARQKAAQAQAEILQRFQKTLDTSNPLKQDQVLEELAHSYLSSSSDRTINSLDDPQNLQRPFGIWKKESNSLSTSPQPTSSASSIKEHLQSSCHESPPTSSVTEAIRSESNTGESIAEELATPGNESLQENSISTIHEKDSQSTVSVNEEGMEEQSFRSLLPSEAHRRGSLERQRSQRHESDEESTPEKELSGPFASGQDSFWKFTLEMVRQYMQEGEMRSAHQSALLRLRQKALKDKTKAELAWLEHLKRRLRDKGEDDKMPPLRKRQRGLLLRLQQEQAEIKRLQEANKAARRERQLILKQQEEIQRIQNSTLRLQEKLKSAENVEHPSELEIQPSSASSHVASDADSRSPSPVSVSGSETSSIMQKLRKMHSHMDAKDICPVHCFFSVFTPQHWASLSVCFPKLHPKFQLYICRQLLRFLTKREQQLVQRRLHAQELLEWKQRLDEEELEIRHIEKQALAAWDNQKTNKRSILDARDKVVEEKNEKEGSSVPSSPSVQTNTSGSLPPEYVASELSEAAISEKILEQTEEHSSISEELLPLSHSKGSLLQSNKSLRGGESSKDSVVGQQTHTPLRPHHSSHTWSEESLSITHSETTSDQSDIEGRIRALKDQLKKRKSVVDSLKREQKKRQKERLRAQEAILLQQLKSYDEYILKTQAELSEEHGTASAPKNALASTGTNLTKSDLTSRFVDTPTYKTVSVNEKQVDFTTDGSVSQEISSASNNEVSKKTTLEHSSVTVSSKDNESSTIQPRPLSPPLRDRSLTATPDSPASSIHSEIPEEMLESHLSESPLPAALNLNLRSPTPEEKVYLSRDHSYSDDFEASAPFRHSVSETPREELEVSYATTPGRELPSDHEEEHSESRSASPHVVESSTINPPSHDLLISSEITDPLAQLCLGDRVLVSGVQPGTLRFKGTTLFAEGLWAGIELDMPEGNNDGSHGGSRYFNCKHQYGIFAPPHKITFLSQGKQIQLHKEEYFLSGEASLDHKNETDVGLAEPKSEQNATLEVTEHLIESQDKTDQNLFLSGDFNLDITTETPSVKEEEKEPNTPLVDLLIKDENEPDALKEQAPNLNILSESLMQYCLKDTISYIQNLRKQREEKIQQSNQELHNSPTTSSLYLNNKEAPNDDIHPQLDLAEIEPGCSLLSVFAEEPDWFDEDFGLSTCRAQQREMKQAQLVEPTPEPCLLVPEPIPKPLLPLLQPEPFLAVPHTALKVEQLVCVAADELWKWKELSGDLQEIRKMYAQDGDEEQNPARCAYKAVVFDLTHQIFEEICCSDQMEMQPAWKKPSRVSPTYARRVRDPHNLEEIKFILIDEVLSLLSLKKEQNHKTDWQRMMKFGKKKRDRVDQILVKELHEEEAQWVNYDEDELFVKMQLADGIFEALIQDTVHVLQSIQQKKNLLMLV
ncbi:centrosome-associated protein 350 isoform X2 [Xenopus laevis]|uniref:Centrosome-associated protein 350 isoform X2 n=1 Tax=Xenopus laevis TaxID=8355 RepID=A0A8J1MX51_XENLA|nr:centrosome-associated protein 350 isoform X2 [Xenopus laevis]